MESLTLMTYVIASVIASVIWLVSYAQLSNTALLSHNAGLRSHTTKPVTDLRSNKQKTNH